jgi:hypothetical protein
LGIVHTSLTGLTHAHTGQAFAIVWAEDFSQGVEYHDNYARGFNQGIKYPNIRMSVWRISSIFVLFRSPPMIQMPAEDSQRSIAVRYRIAKVTVSLLVA